MEAERAADIGLRGAQVGSCCGTGELCVSVRGCRLAGQITRRKLALESLLSAPTQAGLGLRAGLNFSVELFDHLAEIVFRNVNNAYLAPGIFFRIAGMGGIHHN